MDIIFILDESSSMYRYQKSYINGINSLINSQKQINPESYFTMIKFSNEVTCLCSSEKITELQVFTSEHYNPSGMTALYDAIGKGIQLKENSEYVIMIILTDGHENHSKQFNKQEIKNKITELSCRNWMFVFVATNQNAQLIGNELGIETCVTYDESQLSIAHAVDVCNIAIRNATNKWSGIRDHTEVPTDVRDVMLDLSRFSF
jgi:hypothetical protein